MGRKMKRLRNGQIDRLVDQWIVAKLERYKGSDVDRKIDRKMKKLMLSRIDT